jgi:hypothetical protein
MAKRKAAGSRRSPASHVTRRPPELDAAVDHFLDTVCDHSRRYILELLALPREDAARPDVYERRSGEIAQALGLSSSAIMTWCVRFRSCYAGWTHTMAGRPPFLDAKSLLKRTKDAR